MRRIFTILCFLLSGLVSTVHADLSDCGVSDNVEIKYDFFFAGDEIFCSATTSITLGPYVFIFHGARLSLAAPLIELTPPIYIFNGATFLANTGAARKLNDTGITTCSDGDTNGLDCPLLDYPGQDAEYGRDATHNDDSDDHAGFSFTKLDANGNPLPVNASSWSCVRDNVTGLIWEVKTDDSGLRDRDHTYTWYNPDSSTNGGSAGTLDGGSCTGSRCDTRGYVEAVNGQGLCGATDWRMPSVDELTNIVSMDRYGPAIDTTWFPNGSSSSYWSGSPDAYYSYYAWYVDFDLGYSGNDNKGNYTYVRLVRGGQ